MKKGLTSQETMCIKIIGPSYECKKPPLWWRNFFEFTQRAIKTLGLNIHSSWLKSCTLKTIPLLHEPSTQAGMKIPNRNGNRQTLHFPTSSIHSTASVYITRIHLIQAIAQHFYPKNFKSIKGGIARQWHYLVIEKICGFGDASLQNQPTASHPTSRIFVFDSGIQGDLSWWLLGNWGMRYLSQDLALIDPLHQIIGLHITRSHHPRSPCNQTSELNMLKFHFLNRIISPTSMVVKINLFSIV